MSSNSPSAERQVSPLLGDFRRDWRLMNLYERFEQSVTLALSANDDQGVGPPARRPAAPAAGNG